VYEWRPPEQVFDAASMKSLEGAPITRRHPSEMVRADNYRDHTRGQVGQDVRKDADKLAATVFIQDAELVSDVERGDMREVSCGYDCTVLDQSGVVPDGQPDAGKRYDRVQTNIRYNHVAVLERGRAGSEVGLRLDADDNVILPPVEGNRKDTSMKTERIDGVDYEVGTPAHAAAVLRRDEAEKARAKELADLKAERDRLSARADVAEADKAKLTTEVAALKDPKRFDEALAARDALREGARKVLGADFKFDGLDETAVRKAVVGKAYPDFKLDGKSADYLDGMFTAAVAKGAEDSADLAALRLDADGVKLDGGDDRMDVAEKARAEMVKRNRERSSTKAKA
jgi:hypothetical protein